MGPSNACGKGTHEGIDNALRSHTNYTNNRAILRQPDTMRSSFSAAIGAVIAPLLDFVKPTRKEEYSGNVRIYGDAESSVSRGYVNNPLDVAPTTIKQTTLYSPNLFLGTQSEQGVGGYNVSEQQPVLNQRDTTNCSNYGTAGGASSQWGNRSYASDYMQHNNEVKETVVVNGSRINAGNTDMFNNHMNITMNKVETDVCNIRPYGNVAPVLQNMPIGKDQYGQHRGKQQYAEQGVERISGNILSAFKNNPYTQSLQSY